MFSSTPRRVASLLLVGAACNACDGRAVARADAPQERAWLVVSSTAATAQPTAGLPKALIDSVVEVHAKSADQELRCQGVALTPFLVLTAKHCGIGALEVRVCVANPWISVRSINRHPEVDLAILNLATPLPIETFPTLPERCATEQPLVATCYPGLGALNPALTQAVVAFACTGGRCLSEGLELAPGASGCPLFDRDARVVAALGSASLKNSSRVVCLTNSVLAEIQ